MPTISRIKIFPVKALDGIEVTQAEVLPTGSLEHDREFALFREDGTRVNGKRCAAVHKIRAGYRIDSRGVTLTARIAEDERVFQLGDRNRGLEAWLSDYFGFAVLVKRDPGGIPDNTEFHGPTVISTATLKEVAQWFDGIETDEARLRFRANVEIEGVPAFWEDRLAGVAERWIAFRIGDVAFERARPCKRCPVPSRNPVSGEEHPQFQKTFSTKREATLPEWADRSAFEHFYCLGLLTAAAESQAGKILRAGDRVRLGDSQ
jgi:uncharacterized protein YcbX